MATNIVMGEFWLFLPIGPDAIGLCGKMAIACLWLNPPSHFPPSSPKVGPLNNHRVLARTTLIQITTYSIVVDKGAAAACRWVKFQCRQLAAHSLASFYLPRHSIHSMRYSSTNSIHTRQPLRRLYNHSTRAPIHFSSFFYLRRNTIFFFSIIFFYESKFIIDPELMATQRWIYF